MRKFVPTLVLEPSLCCRPRPPPSPRGCLSRCHCQAPRSGTPEEQAACNRDVQRFCRAVINQGDMLILACLQQNRAQISPACNQVLRSHGQ